MYLIVGLGNPDKKYDLTRHNIGFDAVDMISKEYNAPVKKIKFKAIIGEAQIGGERVILAKPQTYMNLSGESVREIASFYKIKPHNIIVFHDDISLPVGKVRIRKKGSDGGHNGLKSIIYQLVSDEFPRVKIGVGAPDNKDYDLADYVLGKFTKGDLEKIIPVLKECSKMAECMIKQGADTAMNKYNGKEF
ncbi:MAG: aminoacyl-tRNA hydrolase [Ruminococcaceae bacterium]|nr:aminoacyl-tRNA hydrolase [Oscillospiraceae bacterium]